MTTRNNMASLNDFLFTQLERLDNEEMSPEELKIEIERSKSIALVSNQIIQNMNTAIKVQQIYDNELLEGNKKPRMLEM